MNTFRHFLVCSWSPLVTLCCGPLCFAVVGDAKDIDWFSPSGEKILLSRPNISVSRSDESTSILTIYHANVDNAGIYKCLAKNADKEAQATVQVKIFRKSRQIFFPTFKVLYFILFFFQISNQHHILNCEPPIRHKSSSKDRQTSQEVVQAML